MSNLQEVMLQAEQFRQQGRLLDAEAIYRQIIQQYPDAHYAYHGLALVALDAGNDTLAIDLINRAIAYDDKIAHYHSNLGEICRRSGRLEAAVAACERATVLAPKEAEAFYNLGLAYSASGLNVEAIRSYRKAIKIQPQHGFAHNNLGAVLERQGELAEAEKCYVRAVTINPQHVEAQNNLGVLYGEKGDIAKARDCFNKAIALSPYFVDAHFNLSSIKTYELNDPHLQLLDAMILNSEQVAIDIRIKLYFAFAKALEDVREYDRSFGFYAEGNRLKRSLIDYRPDKEIFIINKMKSIFTKTAVSNNFVENISGIQPIFIVGMPRSGSTLIEQILDCHPHVLGGGEQLLLGETIDEFLGDETFDKFIGLSPDQLISVGDKYLKKLRKLAPRNTSFVVDKMPANFFYLGAIRSMLPGAKIIHSMRNPLDSCFSCFGKLFKDEMNFTYSLKELGEYYTRYADLMGYWHEVLPANFILDVSYEMLVDNFEEEIRRILDFVGLPWSDQCLAFHENKRRSKTASVAQIQKPLYNTSVGRGVHYGVYLNDIKLLVGNKYNEQVDKWCLKNKKV